MGELVTLVTETLQATYPRQATPKKTPQSTETGRGTPPKGKGA